MHRSNGRSDDSELHAIVSRMRATREELPLDVNATTKAIKQTLDWRTYVRKYPWVCVGLAAGVGYLIVPKGRKSKVREDASRFVERATPQKSPGETKTLFAMVAPLIVNAAVRAVVPRVIDAIRPQPQPAEEDSFEPFSPHRPR